MDQGWGERSSDPRLRRCVWAWIVNSASGGMGHGPVAYQGEYGTMDGRQTVPRAEMAAVIKALLHVQATSQAISGVTIWSD
eukprot:5318394-Karenia_brevis.AAC.1